MSYEKWKAQAQDFPVIDVRHLHGNFFPGLKQKAMGLEVGEGFTVIQTFEPHPLYAAMEALGAAVTTVAYSELFSALQQGLVDAQENPLSNIVVNKYYEVQSYLTLTGHTYTLTTMAINEDVFQSFSPDLQALMLEVAEDATQLCREGLLSQEEVYLEELKQHMEVYDPTPEEMDTFQESTSSVWASIEEEIGSERYNAIVDEVNRLSEELGV